MTRKFSAAHADMSARCEAVQTTLNLHTNQPDPQPDTKNFVWLRVRLLYFVLTVARFLAGTAVHSFDFLFVTKMKERGVRTLLWNRKPGSSRGGHCTEVRFIHGWFAVFLMNFSRRSRTKIATVYSASTDFTTCSRRWQKQKTVRSVC